MKMQINQNIEPAYKRSMNFIEECLVQCGFAEKERKRHVKETIRLLPHMLRLKPYGALSDTPYTHQAETCKKFIDECFYYCHEEIINPYEFTREAIKTLKHLSALYDYTGSQQLEIG